MQPLILFPLKSNMQKGIGAGLAGAGLGAYLLTLDTHIEFFITGIFGLIFGGFLAAKSALALANPTPVFQADAQGFAVKNGAKRPWSEFRSVEVHRVQSGLLTVSRTVRVKVGKSILGGSKQIKWYEMSASPMEMTRQIERYADDAQSAVRGASMDAVIGNPWGASQPAPAPARPMPASAFVPPAPAPIEPDFASAATALTPTPVTFEKRSFAQRLQDTADSPVQSVPSLGERLFGRRKVL